MTAYSLDALAPPGIEPCSALLLLGSEGVSSSVRLRCLPGASAIHLIVRADRSVVLRGEVPAEPGEEVVVFFELREEDVVHASSPGRHLWTLPPEERYAPASPLDRPRSGAGLDLAFIVDGTARRFSRPQDEIVSRPLLSDSEGWHGLVDQVLVFAEGLVSNREASRAAVVAFGDRKPPGQIAEDLIPEYELFPASADERRLRRFEPEQLRRELMAIPPTTGGDFVDALADALEACRDLHWRDEARKLIVVIGDSPGSSLLYPLPAGADLHPRALDVDATADRLHRQGIEIATLYLDVPVDLGFEAIRFQRELLAGVRAQYARLASLPEMAFVLSSFEPESSAAAIRDRSTPIGRGATLGQVVGAEPATKPSDAGRESSRRGKAKRAQ